MKKLISTLSKNKTIVDSLLKHKFTNNIFQSFATKKLPPVTKTTKIVTPKKFPIKKKVVEEVEENFEDENEDVEEIKVAPKKIVKNKSPLTNAKSKKVKALKNEEANEEALGEEEELEVVTTPPVKKLFNKGQNIATKKVSNEVKTNPKKIQQTMLPNIKDLIDEFDSWNTSTDVTSPEFLGKLPLDHDITINNFPLAKKEDADPYNNYIASDRTSEKVRNLINTEKELLCNNYAPLPVVITKGRGAIVEDMEGVKYIDCLSGYGAINFGHCNPFILDFIMRNLTKINLTSRALYTTMHSHAAQLIREIFGFEKVLFMNSGVEACEAAVKLARRFAYRVKKIPENKAKIVYMSGNFWGRSITACGTSDDPSRFTHYGPYDNHHYIVPYGDINKLTEVLNSDDNICAVMAESIQGEAGFIIPDSNFIQSIRNLTRAKNILYIDDEVQAGMGRSGRKLAYEWHLQADKPDIVILAKALSGGSYPVSAVLASKSIMDLIGPGEHGGTFTGNPLGMASAIASLNYFKKNNYNCVNQCNLVGSYLTYLLFKTNFKWLKEVRGRGMMIGLEFHDNIPISTPDICLLLMEKGLITKNSHKFNLRVAPPININLKTASLIYEIFNSVFKNLEKEFPNYLPPSALTSNFINYEGATNTADKYLKERESKPIKYTEYLGHQTEFIEKVKASPKEFKFKNNLMQEEYLDDSLLMKY